MNSHHPLLEKHYKKIIEKAIVGIALVDGSGKFSYVNQMFCDLLEYNKAELMGKSFMEITHPEDLKNDMEMAERVRAGLEEEYSMAKRYISKTGKIIWAKLKVTALDDNGAFEIFLSQIVAIHDPGIKHLLNDMKEELAKNREVNIQLSTKAAFWDGFSDFMTKNWLKLALILVVVGALIGPDGLSRLVEIFK